MVLPRQSLSFSIVMEKLTEVHQNFDSERRCSVLATVAVASFVALAVLAFVLALDFVALSLETVLPLKVSEAMLDLYSVVGPDFE